MQAPEDSKDVVAAAKRVISQNLNALGLRDQRDMTRLIAQSALQVRPHFPFHAPRWLSAVRESSLSLPLY